MVEKMTLQSHAEKLRRVAAHIAEYGFGGWSDTCVQAADAVDAHLAGIGEPVVHGDRRSNHHVHRGPESIPCYCDANGDHPTGKEITAPPIDLAAVREVIASLYAPGQPAMNAAANKLKAAIKGVA